MYVDHPYRFDARGRTAETTTSEHIRDLIEQVLFTAPGERVNRPDFGCGLQRLVFAPNSDELAAASQFLVQGALQQWLGDLIELGLAGPAGLWHAWRTEGAGGHGVGVQT